MQLVHVLATWSCAWERLIFDKENWNQRYPKYWPSFQLSCKYSLEFWTLGKSGTRSRPAALQTIIWQIERNSNRKPSRTTCSLNDRLLYRKSKDDIFNSFRELLDENSLEVSGDEACAEIWIFDGRTKLFFLLYSIIPPVASTDEKQCFYGQQEAFSQTSCHLHDWNSETAPRLTSW